MAVLTTVTQLGDETIACSEMQKDAKPEWGVQRHQTTATNGTLAILGTPATLIPWGDDFSRLGASVTIELVFTISGEYNVAMKTLLWAKPPEGSSASRCRRVRTAHRWAVPALNGHLLVSLIAMNQEIVEKHDLPISGMDRTRQISR